ncbi:conserved hypothetical protein [Ahrensia sp. R2A130]|nr:conserved hypothetical protein [Ahrensia sp. R2A130]
MYEAEKIVDELGKVNSSDENFAENERGFKLGSDFIKSATWEVEALLKIDRGKNYVMLLKSEIEIRRKLWMNWLDNNRSKFEF